MMRVVQGWIRIDNRRSLVERVERDAIGKHSSTFKDWMEGVGPNAYVFRTLFFTSSIFRLKVVAVSGADHTIHRYVTERYLR